MRGRHRLTLALPAAFLGLFFLWPVASLVWRGLSGGGYAAETVLSADRAWSAIGTTLGLATAGTALSLALGLPAAWALFHLRWRGQATVRALVSVAFVLPTIVVAAAFSALLRPSGLLGFLGADQSIGAIIAALAFFNVAVVARVVGGTWGGLDPEAAIAARTLGANRSQVWRHVTLPALTPAITSAAAIVFLFCSTSFGIVLVLGGTRINTVETEIWLQVNQFLDLRAAAALALVQLAIVGLTLVVAGKARRGRGAARGRLDGSRPLTRRDLPLAFAALAPTALLLGLPAWSLLERSLRTAKGWGVDHYVALATASSPGALSAPMWSAALHSLSAAVIAAAIALGLGLIVASALGRSRRAGWIDSVAMLPLGVSAVVVGLGLLLTLYRPLPGGLSLAHPGILVPAAQAVVALPLVVRSLAPTVRSVDPRLRHAAATLGAGPARVWREVDWPALRRPAGLALGLAFAVSLGEFGATAFVARPDYPTLPTAIFRLLSRPGLDNVGMAFAASVLLATVAGLAMLAAERLRVPGEADL